MNEEEEDDNAQPEPTTQPESATWWPVRTPVGTGWTSPGWQPETTGGTTSWTRVLMSNGAWREPHPPLHRWLRQLWHRQVKRPPNAP